MQGTLYFLDDIMTYHRYDMQSPLKVYQKCMQILNMLKVGTEYDEDKLRSIISNIRIFYVYNDNALYIGIKLLIKLEELLDRIDGYVCHPTHPIATDDSAQ